MSAAFAREFHNHPGIAALRRSIDDLPVRQDTERVVLGSILQDHATFAGPAAVLTVDDFHLDRHRRIFRCVRALYGRGEKVDAVTVAEELRNAGDLEHDGLSYLIELDHGLPRIPNLDSYIRILQDTAARRKVMITCTYLARRSSQPTEDLQAIVTDGLDLLTTVRTQRHKLQSIEDLPSIWDCGVESIEYIREPELPKGVVVGMTGDSGSGKSTLSTVFMRDAWRTLGVPALLLDRENPYVVIWDRLKRLGMERGPGLIYWGGWYPDAGPAPLPDDPRILEWIRSHDPRPLIVVDSLTAFFQGGDQNNAGEMRTFMDRCRRCADLGATVIVIHHDGKAETAKEYRGSSDFKASVDVALHVSNSGDNGKLGRVVVRPFKNRIYSGGAITYEYADGRFIRTDEEVETPQTVNEQLTAILRSNPGVNGKRFEELAADRQIKRGAARTFLKSGAVKMNDGPGNQKSYVLADLHP